MTDLERDADHELSAAPPLRGDIQRSTEPGHALAESPEANASPPFPGEHYFRVESASVVLDAAEDLALRTQYFDRGPGGARMATDVVERLLGGPVEGGLHRPRKAFL